MEPKKIYTRRFGESFWLQGMQRDVGIDEKTFSRIDPDFQSLSMIQEPVSLNPILIQKYQVFRKDGGQFFQLFRHINPNLELLTLSLQHIAAIVRGYIGFDGDNLFFLAKAEHSNIYVVYVHVRNPSEIEVWIHHGSLNVNWYRSPSNKLYVPVF